MKSAFPRCLRNRAFSTWLRPPSTRVASFPFRPGSRSTRQLLFPSFLELTAPSRYHAIQFARTASLPPAKSVLPGMRTRFLLFLFLSSPPPSVVASQNFPIPGLFPGAVFFFFFRRFAGLGVLLFQPRDDKAFSSFFSFPSLFTAVPPLPCASRRCFIIVLSSKKLVKRNGDHSFFFFSRESDSALHPPFHTRR